MYLRFYFITKVAARQYKISFVCAKYPPKLSEKRQIGTVLNTMFVIVVYKLKDFVIVVPKCGNKKFTF